MVLDGLALEITVAGQHIPPIQHPVLSKTVGGRELTHTVIRKNLEMAEIVSKYFLLNRCALLKSVVYALATNPTYS